MIVHHAPRIQLQAFEVVRGEQRRQLGAAEACEREELPQWRRKNGKRHGKCPGAEGLTAFLLLGLPVLQDAQGQARVEAAELVGEQRQEAASEICGAEQEEGGQVVLIVASRSGKCRPLAFPEGRQPLALVWLFVRVQLLQHHTRVLSGQVILKHTRTQMLLP